MDGYSDQIILSETKMNVTLRLVIYLCTHTHGYRQVYGSSMDGI